MKSDVVKKVKKYQTIEKEYLENKEILSKIEKNRIEKLNKKLEKLKKNIKNIKDINKIFEEIEREFLDKIIDNEQILEYVGIQKGRRYVKIKCLNCGEIREVGLSKFLAPRPLNEAMCSCKKYKPKKNEKYLNTIRGMDIFVGLGVVKEKEMIWVKCLQCGKYREVIGEDYLNYKCLNTCNHKLENEKDVYEDFKYFKKADMYYDKKDFKIGDFINNTDMFIGYVFKSNTYFAKIKCLKCGEIRIIPIKEFLRYDKKTLVFRKCKCEDNKNKLEKGIYGNLEVYDYNSNKNVYLCKCLCGNNKIIEKKKFELLSGKNLSCGCKAKDISLKSKYNNPKYIGMQINDLKILDAYMLNSLGKELGLEYGIYWLCECQKCKNKKMILAKLVLNGSIKNCGCKNNRYFKEYKVGDIVSGFEIKDIIKIKGEATYWNVKCPFCGVNFVRRASDIEHNHFRSCGCIVKSLGEIYIEEILKELNLKFEEQKSFKNLKNGTLRFDFYLNILNKGVLIEFDGAEHENFKNQFGSNEETKKENFLRLQKNDNLKNKFAKENDIPLLRIKYTKDKEEIKKQICEFLKMKGVFYNV